MIMPFTCPTCHGHKTVQKPPWIAGDQMTWISSKSEFYPCPSCNGTGIIWNELESDSTANFKKGGNL